MARPRMSKKRRFSAAGMRMSGGLRECMCTKQAVISKRFVKTAQMPDVDFSLKLVYDK